MPAGGFNGPAGRGVAPQGGIPMGMSGPPGAMGGMPPGGSPNMMRPGGAPGMAGAPPMGGMVQASGPPCEMCQEPIVGRLVKAVGKTYHPDHFVCEYCSQPFPGLCLFGS